MFFFCFFFVLFLPTFYFSVSSVFDSIATDSLNLAIV